MRVPILNRNDHAMHVFLEPEGEVREIPPQSKFVVELGAGCEARLELEFEGRSVFLYCFYPKTIVDIAAGDNTAALENGGSRVVPRT